MVDRIFRTARNILLGAGAALFLAGCVSSTGAGNDEIIQSRAEEQWIKITQAVPRSMDTQKTAQLQAITDNILRAAGEDPSLWRVALLENEKTINAFALPNRSIGVFTGLTNAVVNDDQLAAVIGHEVAHVRLHHVEERLKRSAAPGILIGAARLPGEVTGIGAAKTAGGLAGGIVAAGTVLPFDRQQELDADLEGLNYLAQAGYDPKEAAALWRNLMHEKQKEGLTPPEVLSTHPSSKRRIAVLEEAAHKIAANSELGEAKP